jgi:Ca2+-transporting ATPase
MGMAGTEVTKEAARMILADDHFATIVLAVREGRGVLDNIRKFLRYLLSSNLAEVLTVFAGVVGAGVIGLKATATGSGWRGGAAAAGHADPVDQPDHRHRARAGHGRGPDWRRCHGAQAQRLRSQRIIDARMGLNVLEAGVVMAVLTLLTLDLFLPGGLIEPVDAWLGAGPHSLDLARTAAFHGAGADAIVQLLQRALGHRIGIPVGVLEPLAVGCGGLVGGAARWPSCTCPGSTSPSAPCRCRRASGAVCVAMASGVLWFREARKLVRRL